MTEGPAVLDLSVYTCQSQLHKFPFQKRQYFNISCGEIFSRYGIKVSFLLCSHRLYQHLCGFLLYFGELSIQGG